MKKLFGLIRYLQGFIAIILCFRLLSLRLLIIFVTINPSKCRIKLRENNISFNEGDDIMFKNNEIIDKVCEKLSIGAGMITIGYLIGRFTAVSDLKKGYLNMLIPKNKK